MKRKELALWVLGLTCLLLLNVRSSPASSSSEPAQLRTASSAPTDRVKPDVGDVNSSGSGGGGPVPSKRHRPTQRPLVKSKLYARADEDRPPPPELAARPVVTLPADETDDPLAVARGFGNKRNQETKAADQAPPDADAANLIERQQPTWPRPHRPSDCHYLNDLYDTVLDAGGTHRARILAAVIALYAANATGDVADVGSTTLHATLALMLNTPQRVLTLTFDRAMFDSGRQLHVEYHTRCEAAGYIGDSEDQLANKPGFDVLIAGTHRHAHSMVDRIAAGDIAVHQYFIVAETSVAMDAKTLDVGNFLPQLVRHRWTVELQAAHLGLVVFRSPRFNPFLAASLPTRAPPHTRHEDAIDAFHVATLPPPPAVTTGSGDVDVANAAGDTLAPNEELAPVPHYITGEDDRLLYRGLQRALVKAARQHDSERAAALHERIDRLVAKYHAQLRSKAPEHEEYILGAGHDAERRAGQRYQRPVPATTRNYENAPDDVTVVPRAKRPLGKMASRVAQNHLHEADAIEGEAVERDGQIVHMHNGGDVGGSGGVVGQRQLTQLADGARLLPMKRPAMLCQDAFHQCSGSCNPALLCGAGEESINKVESDFDEESFPSARANALAFRASYNPLLPAAAYVLPLAAFGMHYAQRGGIVVYGCYPSLIAAALVAAKGEHHRVWVISSGRGCNALRARVRGGLRAAVPEANVKLVNDADSFRFTEHNAVAIYTTVRMMNIFAAQIQQAPPGSLLCVLGTSYEAEPLKVKISKFKPLGRFHLGVGLTTFTRPLDHDSVFDVVPHEAG